jgi:hypothetical protein
MYGMSQHISEGVAMFSRIRYAAKVLSYSRPKVSKFDDPDLVFEEQYQSQVSKASARIGEFIEILIVASGVGFFVGPALLRIFPAKPTASLLTITGITVSIVSILANRVIEDINTRIRLQLKIGERLAPYFGHKITKAVQILRG